MCRGGRRSPSLGGKLLGAMPHLQVEMSDVGQPDEDLRGHLAQLQPVQSQVHEALQKPVPVHNDNNEGKQQPQVEDECPVFLRSHCDHTHTHHTTPSYPPGWRWAQRKGLLVHQVA